LSPKNNNQFNPAEDKLVGYGYEDESFFNDGHSDDDSEWDKYMRLSIIDKIDQQMRSLDPSTVSFDYITCKQD
jgi:hypothetical protein